MRFIAIFISMLLAFGGVTAMSKHALARPVSYAGGTTVMTMLDRDSEALHLSYSPTSQYSVGFGTEYDRDKDYFLNTFQINNLIKRWNNAGSQGNLYLQSGVGIASSVNGDLEGNSRAAGFTGLTTDWENRRYLVSYTNQVLEAGNVDGYFTQSARVGIAPYIGDYGDIHTWLMLQIDHKPEDPEPVIITPLVRLFKGTNLVEAGVSNRGDVLVNLTFQY